MHVWLQILTVCKKWQSDLPLTLDSSIYILIWSLNWKKTYTLSQENVLYTCIYFPIFKMRWHFSNIVDKTVVFFSSKVMSQINSGSGIKKKLFNMALASKENELKK